MPSGASCITRWTSCSATSTPEWRVTMPSARTPGSTATARRRCKLSSRAPSWRTIGNWIGSSRHPSQSQRWRSRYVRQIKSWLGHIKNSREHAEASLRPTYPAMHQNHSELGRNRPRQTDRRVSDLTRCFLQLPVVPQYASLRSTLGPYRPAHGFFAVEPAELVSLLFCTRAS